MDVNALVERGGFHFPRPRDPRADDAVVLMQEGFFDADSAAGTLGVFAVEINWPDGKGTDGSIEDSTSAWWLKWRRICPPPCPIT